jgi:light-regulated signal transduction histidine kinase (bacteriophytochrome)
VIRSLRFRLAPRVAGGMTGAMLVISLVGIIGARHFLDEEMNASLLNVASIQAAALTEAPGGEMRFLEWDLTPLEAAHTHSVDSPGTGLGLAIVRAIARAHGGEARVGAGRNGGARFTIVLPTAPAAGHHVPGSRPESRPSGSDSGTG